MPRLLMLLVSGLYTLGSNTPIAKFCANVGIGQNHCQFPRAYHHYFTVRCSGG